MVLWEKPDVPGRLYIRASPRVNDGYCPRSLRLLLSDLELGTARETFNDCVFSEQAAHILQQKRQASLFVGLNDIASAPTLYAYVHNRGSDRHPDHRTEGKKEQR